jgi:hypothetical protein
MNFDAELFIDHAQRKISQFRRSATWSLLSSFLIAIPVVLVMITLFVQLALRGLYSFDSIGAQDLARTTWEFCNANVHLLWITVLSLPFPKALPRPNGSMLPWIVTLTFYLGIMWACGGLKQRAVTLRKIADKAEETLNMQTPLLMQMAANGQGVVIGGVSGNSNTINAGNRVVHVLKEGEKESKSWKVIVAIAIPVLTWIANHYLHLT